MRMTSILGSASALVISLAAGCGGNVETSETGGSTSTSTNTTTTTGTEDVCAAFHDEVGAGSVTVIFRNESPYPIFLPTMCSAISYDISPQTGTSAGPSIYDTSCLQTCEDLQKEYPVDCGACQETTIVLTPNATLTRVWDGTLLATAPSMPASCSYMGESQLSSCSRITAAPAGKYSASAIGFGSCQGECNCDADGVCFGSPTGSMAYSNFVELSFPEQSTVEIVFNPCVFGCPI